jgi:FKBP-type peptidyl-prolyl cis-trans isomerase
LKVEDVNVGTGATAERGTTVTIRWRGTLNRGDEFGSGEVSFRIGERRVVAGLELGVVGMRVGGTRRLRVSPHLGYRDQAVPGVPANAVLNFEVDLLDVRSSAEPSAAADRPRD